MHESIVIAVVLRRRRCADRAAGSQRHRGKPDPPRAAARARAGARARPAAAAPAPAPAQQAAPPAPAEPVSAEPAPGTLPVVTGQFATVTVIPNEQLRRSGGSTLGDVLFDKPGITGSSFAPGASSRPVIRGLDVNRVGVAEN